MKMKEWFGFTTGRKVGRANVKVRGALSMFSKAISKIDNANKMLSDAIKEDLEHEKELLKKVDSVKMNRDKAKEEMEANNRLKNKFKEFTK